MSAPAGGFITGVAGNKIDEVRLVPELPPARTVQKAWLTVKLNIDDADPGIFQKVINPNYVAGQGAIATPGDGSGGQPAGTAVVWFELTPANTTALGWTVAYYYDIKVLLDNGDSATTEQGRLQLLQPVTIAST